MTLVQCRSLSRFWCRFCSGAALATGAPKKSPLENQPQAPRVSRYIWIARFRCLRSPVAWLLLVTALLAWPAIFSTFALYDDEGYVMMTLATYMQGHRLYGETHTQYGPAFYYLTAPLHSILDWPLTQTGVRIKTLFIWTIAVWFCFSIVRRMSHSNFAAIVTGVFAALHLDKLSLEPGHPQELALLGTLGILMLIARSMYVTTNVAPTLFSHSSWLTVGFVAGIVGLVKLNCGLVTAIPLIVVAAIQMPWARKIRWGLLALVAVPSVMVAWTARSEPTISFWALWIGLSSVVLLYSAIPEKHSFAFPSVSPLIAIVTGGGSAIALIATISLSEGITVSELWFGLIGQHADFANCFFVPIDFPLMALIGLATAVGCLLYKNSKRFHDHAKPAIWCWIALSISLTSCLPLQHGLIPRGAGLLLAWAAPGWILWFWRHDVATSPKKLTIGLIAILSPLIAFPVSGTQVSIGTLPALIVIGILSGESLVERARLVSSNGSSEWLSPVRLSRLVGFCTAIVLVLSTSAHWARYLSGQPLDLPGTYCLRLPATVVREQRAIVEAIKKCETSNLLFEGNNHNRFYFWTGMRPLTTANPTFWPLMLCESEQQQLAKAIDGQTRLCVVRVPKYEWLYFDRVKPIRERLDARWQHQESVGDWEIGVVEQ
ncbi:MAG: hypothetical protein SGI77_25595 [Pirellulaceae bacterium]|nr:hypothetical protein [Pirellulaceae bacterium]